MRMVILFLTQFKVKQHHLFSLDTGVFPFLLMKHWGYEKILSTYQNYHPRDQAAKQSPVLIASYSLSYYHRSVSLI